MNFVKKSWILKIRANFWRFGHCNWTTTYHIHVRRQTCKIYITYLWVQSGSTFSRKTNTTNTTPRSNTKTLWFGIAKKLHIYSRHTINNDQHQPPCGHMHEHFKLLHVFCFKKCHNLTLITLISFLWHWVYTRFANPLFLRIIFQECFLKAYDKRPNQVQEGTITS